ncbi:protein polyglycylase ttll10-like isoform x4 [Plakobranchus ocellatus]|uniref:Protein polyglycylase ttll10-like isoform x4 n=1 Tax=Plakobranchus ocellatus TaxID=259542 RepID=A0AAV4BTF5_9GAST|nr:protein polyglycylase ttll10-like isoform x4 [Plakobranchus ocellatus]
MHGEQCEHSRPGAAAKLDKTNALNLLLRLVGSFLCAASAQQGDFSFPILLQAGTPVSGLETATEGSLQMSRRIRYKLPHRCPS